MRLDEAPEGEAAALLDGTEPVLGGGVAPRGGGTLKLDGQPGRFGTLGCCATFVIRPLNIAVI